MMKERILKRLLVTYAETDVRSTEAHIKFKRYADLSNKHLTVCQEAEYIIINWAQTDLKTVHE